MAILSPADLPSVLRVHSAPIKNYILTKLGHPQVEVELSENQLETIVRVCGDFIAGYFPREQRLAILNSIPLQSTYPMPKDAYWIQEVHWNAAMFSIGDLFGSEAYLLNAGSLAGGQQSFLLDFHLLQAFRKTSQRILSTEGHWEVIGEADGESKDQRIRLYPTPKGAFPVVVLYIPVINHFRSPQAKMLAYDYLLAEAKTIVGSARRKISGMPSPDGGSITLDGADLIQEGIKEKEEIVERAIGLGEPLGVFMWSILPLLVTLASLIQ